jgi:hypothetical protein
MVCSGACVAYAYIKDYARAKYGEVEMQLLLSSIRNEKDQTNDREVAE